MRAGPSGRRNCAAICCARSTAGRTTPAWRERPFGYLGFARLAIMGLTPEGMQPFEDGGSWAACNGEIYGFRPLRRELEAKGYRFRSDSDCEVLLPLWREHGCAMFRRLDAEFACVLYDGQSGSLVAARDPIGIRPLFYGRAKAGGIALPARPSSWKGWGRRDPPLPARALL